MAPSVPTASRRRVPRSYSTPTAKHSTRARASGAPRITPGDRPRRPCSGTHARDGHPVGSENAEPAQRNSSLGVGASRSVGTAVHWKRALRRSPWPSYLEPVGVAISRPFASGRCSWPTLDRGASWRAVPGDKESPRNSGPLRTARRRCRETMARHPHCCPASICRRGVGRHTGPCRGGGGRT
jgi:hypothetical protein